MKRFLLIIIMPLFLVGCEQLPLIKLCGDYYWYSVPSDGVNNYKEVKNQAKYVGESCSNQHRWIKLVVSVYNSGNYDGVEKIVEMMLSRKFNFIKNDHHRLTDGYSEFVEFIEGDEFKKTKPGKELAKLIAGAEARKKISIDRIEHREEGVVPPEEMYKITKDTCPYYCCLDKRFVAKKDTILYKEINSDTEVGFIRKGDVVKNIYSENHSHPIPIVIAFDCGHNVSKPVLQMNDILFVSKSLGEGMYSYWHDGRNMAGYLNFENRQLFKIEQSDCVGEYLYDEKVKRRTGTNWSHMKLTKEDGTELIGWTSDTYNFKNIHQCVADPYEEKDAGRREKYRWMKKE